MLGDGNLARIERVKREDIIGKAWLRIWPLSDFGVLKHQ